MTTVADRNRRTAVLTFAGVGFFHLMAIGVVVLLLSAGPSETDREIPQRPTLRLDGEGTASSPVGLGGAASGVPREDLETHWTARHKDAASPWSVDPQGRIYWR
jgi:hypothetical protein